MYVLREEALSACGVSASDSVLIALSGGADSVALLLECIRLKSEGALRSIAAAHLNHGIRETEADRDETFCRDLCHALGVPFFARKADVRKIAEENGLSLETAARDVRYAFLEEMRRQNGFSCIATAHHANDQAETVLLHLLRGSGTDGLCGMRYRNGHIVRPLLDRSKEELLAYLSERGQSFCIDSTNAKTDAARNRVRHELLPLMESMGPDIVRKLCRTARFVQTDADWLNEIADRTYRIVTDRRKIAALAPAVRMRVLKRYLPYDSFDRNDLQTLDALLTAQTGTCRSLKEGFWAWVDDARLFAGMPASASYELPVKIGASVSLPGGTLAVRPIEGNAFLRDRSALYMDADRLCGALTVRTRKDGDRFQPFGMHGTKLLSDYFTDRKTPRFQRNVPLLCDKTGIVAVVGHTIDERVRVTENTKSVLKIVYEEDSEHVG